MEGIRGIPRQLVETFLRAWSRGGGAPDHILTLVKAFSLVPSGSSGSKALFIKIVHMIKALIIPVSFSTGRNVFQIRQFAFEK